MKKNFYSFILIFFVLLTSQVNSFAQHVQLHSRMGLHIIQPKKNNTKSNKNNRSFFTFRTSSCSNDSIVITRQSQIDSFNITNPTCTIIRKLIIDGTGASPAITRLDSLKYITAITQNFSVSHTSVTNLSVLINLTQIGDSLQIQHNAQLTSIGLNNLTQLGTIYFLDLPALTSIAGLSNNINTINSIYIDSTALTSLAGLGGIVSINDAYSLQIYHNPVVSLSDLTNLSTCGFIDLDNDTSLASIGLNNLTQTYGFLFSALPNLTSLGGLSNHLTNTNIGTFWMINTGLTDLSGLDNITGSSNFYIQSNPNLTSLHGLENLTGDVGGGINIYGNPVLTNISALSGITTINNGTLEISANDSLNNLTGLDHITTIGGGLYLRQNNNLTSLAALNSSLVIQGNNDSIRIVYNQQLSLCSVPALCNYLKTNSSAEIHDNATGCSSIAEIRASCTNPTCGIVSLKTWNGSTNDDWNIASNWSPAGVPATCDSVVIHSGITPTPKLTSDATIHALTMESGTQLYMNGSGLIVNGDIIINNVLMGGGTFLKVNNSNNILIQNSTFYIDNITLTGYKDSLDLRTNTIKPSSSINNNTLTIIDDPTRSGSQNISGNRITGNLSITANATSSSAETNISPGGDEDHVTGNATFIINTPVYFKVGYGSAFWVGGSLITNSNNSGNPDFGDIVFNGSSDCHITQLGTAPISIGSVSTYMHNGAYLILDQNVYIKNNFLFFGGIIKSATDKLLVFENNAGVDPTSIKTSYVWGPIKKIGAHQFGFQTGDGIYSGFCSISGIAASADTVTAQYFHTNPSLAGYDTSKHEASLNKVSGKEYWKIDYVNGPSGGRINGTAPPPIQVTLPYDSSQSDTISSIYGLRVGHWNGTLWENRGVGGVSGNSQHAVVTSSGPETNFGIFTLSSIPFHLPVITVGKIDSVVCIYKVFRIPFTVDLLPFTNNQFFAQLSDSTGSFASPNNIGNTNVGVGNYADTINAYLPPYNPSPTANFKIRVIATSPSDTSINTKSLKMKTVPTLEFTILGPNPVCLGSGSAKYYTSAKEADTATTYTWDISGGGGTFTSTHKDTAYVNWTSSGTAYLDARPTNSCGDGQYHSIQLIVSQPAPTAAPTLTNAGRWLYASQPPAGQYTSGYRWYRNDSLVKDTTVASYYASAAGTYKVKYYTLCTTGPASNTISFSANSIPQTVSFPAIPNKIYTDSSFVINATATSGLPVSFSIVSGPGNIPGNIYHITGTGLVTIRTTQSGDNTYDTSSWVQQNFTVNKAPQTIIFTAISDTVFNTPPINLSASSTSSLPISYSIISGPGTIIGNTVIPTGVGIITVRAFQTGDTNYLAAAPLDRSFCVRVSVLNPISGPATICPTKPVTYSVDSIAGATYSWQIAGGSTLSSTSNKVRVTWPSPGTYTLIVSASGNCGSPSKIDSLVVTAITSVPPDSVNNMLPANGVINQQLPLTLSWIPANPNLFYTYDVYLWKISDPQPSTPYVANLTTVNYTIPVNSGLPYNTTYKWMVVAHNGSCMDINTGPIQQFSLIPLADLQVYNVSAPTSAFSGQNISVTWKVKNNGPGNTQLNQRWTDAVFISKDSVLNFNAPGNISFPLVPLLVATKLNVSALNTGEFYSDTATFILPRDYSGPLYMHVITNYAPPANNPLIEVTLANDTSHALPYTDVALSPTPDLRVDSVVNPNNTFSGSTINVQVKIKNYGVNASGYWVDKVYISKDPLFNINNAILLKVPNGTGSYYPATDALFPHYGGLQQDSSYTVSLPVVVPNFIYGSYFVYVFTNANADLYEGPNQNNNIGHGNLIQVFLTPTPKLTPVFTFTVHDFSNAGLATIGWQIQNQGAYDNIQKNQYPNGSTGLPWGYSEWDDKLYISADSTGLNTDNAYYIGNYHHREVILPQQYYYDVINWQVPKDFPRGTYYLYSQANVNKTVYEYPGIPQIARSNAFTIYWPDLTVPNVSVPTTGNSGQPININYTLLNIGQGAVNNHYRKDYIYLGNNSTFDGTALLIDSVFYNSASVPVNVQQSLQKLTKLPNGVSGSKYVFVLVNADSSFKENNLNNNINTSGAPINISLSPNPDLQVTSILMANTVFTSIGFPFQYTVANTGLGIASGTWKDSIFISCNSVFSPATSYFLALRSQQNYIPSSGSYSDSFNLIVPLTFLINNTNCLNNDTAQVYFFVKTNADNGVYEGSLNNNNVSGTTQKTVINSIVDHIVTSVSSNDSALVGRYFKVNWTVKNIGLNPNDYTYNEWRDGVYLSTDSVLNSNTPYLGLKAEYLRLNHNQSYNDSAYFQIPNLVSGYYYLFVKTNVFAGTDPFYNTLITAERNFSNNVNLRRDATNQPIKVYVTNPPASDLVNTIISAPTTTAVGQPIKIVYKITNTGVGETYPSSWTDDIWLSNSFQPGGVFLSRKYHNGTLLPGQSYIDSATATIPINQPQGNYTIVLNTDQDHNVYESNHNNNISYQYISVYIPPPVDLVVNNISIADTVILGNATTINWKLANVSINTANGTETDGIYLGKDSTTNTNNDILIGTKINQLNLLPLNDTSLTIQSVVSGVTEGNYFVKIKTDILNNIIETNKQNNTGILNHNVYVTIKILPINTITADTLTSNYLYYKLIVPAALRGKTISVKLSSNDSLTANNQMYIGLGYLPSAARFDYGFTAPNFGNQQIIIESVVDSVYYIAARGTKPNASYQAITLQATVLPFAIVSINATHGGNTGNVTIEIKGSLFSNNMQASIQKSGNTIVASAVYFVNSATVYATFNLQGAPLGVYDVTLKKPDSSTATLPSAFTVEQTNNGGLLTGGGNNTGQTGSGNAPGCDPGAPSGLNSQLQTQVIIPPKVFASWPFIVQINYTNASNVDIPAQVRILYSLNGAPVSLTEAGLSEGKTNLYIEFKDASGPPNTIRAGGSGTIKVYSKAPINAIPHELLHFTLQ